MSGQGHAEIQQRGSIGDDQQATPLPVGKPDFRNQRLSIDIQQHFDFSVQLADANAVLDDKLMG